MKHEDKDRMMQKKSVNKKKIHLELTTFKNKQKSIFVWTISFFFSSSFTFSFLMREIHWRHCPWMKFWNLHYIITNDKLIRSFHLYFFFFLLATFQLHKYYIYKIKLFCSYQINLVKKKKTKFWKKSEMQPTHPIDSLNKKKNA